MGILSQMQEKAQQQWAENLTLEQIEDLERQGCDMTEYRIIYGEQQAEKQRFIDSTDLSKLDPYKKTRSVGDTFVEDVAKFNKMSDKNKQKLETAPLVYGKVVEAHYALFKSNPKNKDGGGIVFLYATDDAHRYDEEWLTKTANRILEMKESVKNQPETAVEKIFGLLGLKKNLIYSLTVGASQEKKKVQFLPEDCRGFINSLCLDASRFCYRLGKSLSEGAEAWCVTYSLWDQSKLPMAQIPHNRIIPLLITEQKEGYGGIDDGAQLIPPAYYTK
jgi:hypothetical protein